jgi:hypothetical protein
MLTKTLEKHKTDGEQHDEQYDSTNREGERRAYQEGTYKAPLSLNPSKHYLHNYTNSCVITQINYIGVIVRGIVRVLSGGGYRV